MMLCATDSLSGPREPLEAPSMHRSRPVAAQATWPNTRMPHTSMPAVHVTIPGGLQHRLLCFGPAPIADIAATACHEADAIDIPRQQIPIGMLNVVWSDRLPRNTNRCPQYGL